MNIRETLTLAFLLLGTLFFLAGAVGLLRFPDVHSRLHALSKADNLALGFIILAMAIQREELIGALKLFLIWPLALIASAANCYLIANWSIENESNGQRT